YEVQSGDTLVSIAKENTKNTNISVDEYIDEVIENNQLSSEKITIGNHIIIATYAFQ
nr:LysM peptidoglycan-binding domain-containing protein [Eubacterium sp.]